MIRANRGSDRRQRGASVVETVIVVTCFAAVAFGVQGVVKASDGLSRRTHATSTVKAADRRGIEGIADLLRDANPGTLLGFDLGGVANALVFQKVTGSVAGTRELALPATLLWQSVAPVPGVVDAGEVVLVEGLKVSSIVSRVPRGGFTVTNLGTGLKIHLDTFTVIRGSEVAKASADTFVSFRN